MEGKVIFIGAGPGAPDLITIRGYEAIKNADCIIYAGSLVNEEILVNKKENAKVYNSAKLNLDEIIEIIETYINKGKIVARVHTGDPSIYGAIAEQIRILKNKNIKYELIPGVSSVFASASALETELTLPEVSQTVIITRPEGRTPKPKKESLESLAAHNATMCIFLGVGMIEDVVKELTKEYPKETPVAVVKKASWPDEEIIEGTLENIVQKVKKANITKTAMIIVSNVLKNETFKESKLYDSKFTHEYRKAKKD